MHKYTDNHMDFATFSRATNVYERQLRKAKREKDNTRIKRLRQELVELVNTYA
jgi:hypothetical protein